MSSGQSGWGGPPSRGGQGSSQRGGNTGQNPSPQDHMNRLIQNQSKQKGARKNARGQANDTSRTMRGEKTSSENYDDMIKNRSQTFKNQSEDPDESDPGSPDPIMEGTNEYYDQYDRHDEVRSRNDTRANRRLEKHSNRESGYSHSEDFTRREAVDLMKRSTARSTETSKTNDLERENRRQPFPGEDREPNAG